MFYPCPAPPPPTMCPVAPLYTWVYPVAIICDGVFQHMVTPLCASRFIACINCFTLKKAVTYLSLSHTQCGVCLQTGRVFYLKILRVLVQNKVLSVLNQSPGIIGESACLLAVVHLSLLPSFLLPSLLSVTLTPNSNSCF